MPKEHLRKPSNYWFIRSFLEICGKDVVFLCGDVSKEFCEKLAGVAGSMSLQPRIYEVIKDHERRRLEQIATREELEQLSAQSRADEEVIESVRGCDAVVWIGLHEDFDVFYLVDKRLVNNVLSKSFLFLSFPSRAVAVQLGMEYGDYCDIYIKSLNYPWDKMKVLGEGLKEQLIGSRSVNVTSPLDTNFSLEFKDEKFKLFYGILDEELLRKGKVQLQLPAGELYIELEEPNLEGTMVSDVPQFLNGHIVSNVMIKVSKGVVTDFKSDKGRSIFNKLFKSEETRVVSELGFGLNPAIKIYGSKFLDEKAYGTIHVGFGRMMTLGHADFVISDPTIHDGRLIKFKQNAQSRSKRGG